MYAGGEVTRSLGLDVIDLGQDDSDLDREIANWCRQADARSLEEGLSLAIARADAIADRRQAAAEIVARQDATRARLDVIETKRAQLDEKSTEFKTRRTELNGVWHALWEPCGVTPSDPTTMLEWLANYHDWVERREHWHSTSQRLAQVMAERDDLEHQLRELVDWSDTSLDQLFPYVAQRIETLRRDTQRRDELAKRRQQRQAECGELDARVSDIEDQIASWHQEWSARLQEWGFPAEWPIATARQVLTLHQRWTTLSQAYDQAKSRFEVADDTLQRFRSRAMEIFERVDRSEPPSTTSICHLYTELEAAQKVEQKRRRAEIERTRLRRLFDSKQRHRDQIAGRLAELLAVGNVATEAEFLRIADVAGRRKELTRKIDTLRSQIDAASGEYDWDSFLERLQTIDNGQLDAEIDEVERAKQAADEEFQDAVSQIAVHDETLRAWQGESVAVEVASELESLHGQLRDAVDEWAPLMLAQVVLQQALTRFEREHQPALLREANSLFRRMTDGRYCAIRRHLVDGTSLVVETKDGIERQPEQLSTGTREQLYLAIRLAYIRRYSLRSESLPLVMDDVLVNFDDRRARQTMRVLAEFGEDHQILFLTCHESTRDMAEKVLPNVTIHRMLDENTELMVADG